MKSTQSGVSLMGLMLGLFILVLLALFAMKIIPSYLEFATAKNAIEGIARERQASTPTEVRNAFEARATIDDIRAVSPKDLEITKEGNEFIIAFSYRKEVPVFSNVALCIDYAASTKGQ